ncbi:hypothetical protein V8G54_014070 [Vigna mungo]|uniref:Heme-binding protein 2-like n=1 Tax=Vigna mungo TaxID=3915 RepID=A0AAQ3NFY9_VIGMU
MSATTFQFLVLWSFILAPFLSVEGKIPESCKKNECPTYDVTEMGKDYEIRSYNSPVWISTSPFQNNSLVDATLYGLARLINYVEGKNKEKKVIKMTFPVISEVSKGNSIVVSLYVPKANQENPPSADDLKVQRWKASYIAVRQYGRFVKDSDVKTEVAALNASLAATKWAAKTPNAIFVAQYNFPFELYNRVNEIWFLY